MQKSYESGTATHIGSESCGAARKGSVEALTREPHAWIFRFRIGWFWHRALSRRSQNSRILSDRMRRLIARWLPVPTVCHPCPLHRVAVLT
jgi:hypothetical protein